MIFLKFRRGATRHDNLCSRHTKTADCHAGSEDKTRRATHHSDYSHSLHITQRGVPALCSVAPDRLAHLVPEVLMHGAFTVVRVAFRFVCLVLVVLFRQPGATVRVISGEACTAVVAVSSDGCESRVVRIFEPCATRASSPLGLCLLFCVKPRVACALAIYILILLEDSKQGQAPVALAGWTGIIATSCDPIKRSLHSLLARGSPTTCQEKRHRSASESHHRRK